MKKFFTPVFHLKISPLPSAVSSGVFHLIFHIVFHIVFHLVSSPRFSPRFFSPRSCSWHFFTSLSVENCEAFVNSFGQNSSSNHVKILFGQTDCSWRGRWHDTTSDKANDHDKPPVQTVDHTDEIGGQGGLGGRTDGADGRFRWSAQMVRTVGLMSWMLWANRIEFSCSKLSFRIWYISRLSKKMQVSANFS